MAALLQLPGATAAAAWLHARGARALVADSRAVQPGTAFLAWRGATHDARRFVAPALAAGAAACLVDADGLAAFGFGDDARIAALPGLKTVAGIVASDFLGAPSRRLDVIAVTGTNGKTSTTWWLAQALARLGRRCGVVGTLGVGAPPVLEASGLTTPDAVALQSAFARFADEGYAAAAIEASSIGLVERRLAGTAIKVAIFTNFTRDHLDYHRTLTAYWQAKATLFDWPGLQAAVVNIDDEQGAALAAQLAGRGPAPWTTSARDAARLVARGVGYCDGGLCFDVVEGAAAPVALRTALIGEFNVANLLGVIGGLRALGVPLADAVDACAALTPVPGRMQRVEAGPSITAYGDRSPEGIAPGMGRPGAQARRSDDLPEVVVDYAHTPDALEKALLALRPFARERGGRLWCLFGCGGNRDAAKRPLMGAIAERLADHVVVTSDNPRHEAPNFILSQILVGVIGHDDVDVIEDRREAIAYAVEAADARDVLLVAGKGHEATQEVAGVRHPFSDVEVARDLLAARARGGAA